jgi:glycerol-3-phosphate dehydrogenase
VDHSNIFQSFFPQTPNNHTPTTPITTNNSPPITTSPTTSFYSPLTTATTTTTTTTNIINKTITKTNIMSSSRFFTRPILGAGAAAASMVTFGVALSSSAASGTAVGGPPPTGYHHPLRHSRYAETAKAYNNGNGNGSSSSSNNGNNNNSNNSSSLTGATTRPIPCRDGTLVFPFSTPSRSGLMKKLETDFYDVLVIGGGCVGAGVAHDAAMRGLKVALVEADDFCAGTSSRSTKLIHGGVRYLENAFWKLDIGEYRLVKEALHERSHMLHAAPHMARALPIMVPCEHWWQVPYYWAGGKVYDLVAGRNRHVPPSMFLGKAQALYAFPMLNPDKIVGAIVYYDGQMNDTRFGLSIVLTAIQSGATALNYVKVEKLLATKHQSQTKGRDGELPPPTAHITGAIVRDMVNPSKTFEIKARNVINCTGAFSDSIRTMAHDAVGEVLGTAITTTTAVRTSSAAVESETTISSSTNNQHPSIENLIIPAGGVHVVLPDHFSPELMGLIVPETSDGRVLFFLPWEGGTLCGTTDGKSDLTMLPRPRLDEIDFILSESSRYLNRPVTRSDVRAAWSGLRPLVKDLKKSKQGTAALSREHVVEVSAGNMVTIAGGKWTTYRKMAEDALDKVLELNPRLKSKAGPCRTPMSMLIGADRARIVCDQRFDIIQITLREHYGFDRDVAQHLTSAYGTRSLQIAELIIGGYPTRAPGLHPKRLVAKHPVLEAEIVFAVEQEMALTPIDFLARRTRLAFLDHDAAVEALPVVVEFMGKLLNWSNAKKELETKNALVFLETFKVPLDSRDD